MRISKFGGTPRPKPSQSTFSPPHNSPKTFTRNEIYQPVSLTDEDSFFDDRQYLAAQSTTNQPK